MLLVDTVKGRVIDDDELKESYAEKQPYGEWLDRYLVNLSDLKIPNKRVEEYTAMRSVQNSRKPLAILTKSTVLLF